MGENQSIWLNSAHLGQFCAKDDRHDPSGTIRSVLDGIQSWVSSWFPTGDFEFFAVTSTMSACDAALLSLASTSDVFIYTSAAHETIKESVWQSARLAGAIKGERISVACADLADLDLTCAESVATDIADRIASVADGRSGVAVIEHVTFEYGIRLPVEAIVGFLKVSAPNLRVVIDGAQAVGIWRPPRARYAAYLGCFHKFIGAPPALGFLALDRSLAHQVQAHVENLKGSVQGTEAPVYQTVDLDRMRAVVKILKKQHLLSDVSGKVKRVAGFNRALEIGLAPRESVLGCSVDPELRSHITSIKFASTEETAVAVIIAEGRGYLVQQFGTLLRISVGGDVQSSWGHDLGLILAGISKRVPIAPFFTSSISEQGS